MTYEVALAALADPTRRQVFEQLRSGPRAVGDIAGDMPVSRPAVSQHLKVLKEAGLVSDRAEGTRRVYFVDPHGLGALRRWLDQFWGEALAAFEAEMKRLHPVSHSPGSTHVTHSHRRSGAKKRARQRAARSRL